MQETWECSTDEPDGHLICDLQICSSVSCLRLDSPAIIHIVMSVDTRSQRHLFMLYDFH